MIKTRRNTVEGREKKKKEENISSEFANKIRENKPPLYLAIRKFPVISESNVMSNSGGGSQTAKVVIEYRVRKLVQLYFDIKTLYSYI